MLAHIDKFFDFVKEREAIRLRKEADSSFWVDGKKQWTLDPILANYKFTNVHRHHDRTSQVLIEEFYEPNFNDDQRTLLMNAALFRYFGTYEFAKYIGWTSHDEMDEEFWEHVKNKARERINRKQRVFTGAYVITNQGISAPKEEVVVDYFLKGLQKNLSEIIDVRESTDSWKSVSNIMRRIPGFGGSGFMTKEVLLDTTYTGFWKTRYMDGEGVNFTKPKDWWEWTPVGPGARRGSSRVNGDESAKPDNEEVSLYTILSLTLEQNKFLNENIERLAPHDIQFQLCEFDKYERVRLGQGKPRSRYRAT